MLKHLSGCWSSASSIGSEIVLELGCSSQKSLKWCVRAPGSNPQPGKNRSIEHLRGLYETSLSSLFSLLPLFFLLLILPFFKIAYCYIAQASLNSQPSCLGRPRIWVCTTTPNLSSSFLIKVSEYCQVFLFCSVCLFVLRYGFMAVILAAQALII